MANNRGRCYWMAVREQVAVRHLRNNMSMAQLAVVVGVEPDYARKTFAPLIDRYNIDYNPSKDFVPYSRVDDASRNWRRRLGDSLYMIRQFRHGVETAMATGIPQRAQTRAVNAPFDHDWSFGEITGLAGMLDVTFGELMIALDHDESSWRRWLDERTQAQREIPITQAG